jgi:hypothetical protein
MLAVLLSALLAVSPSPTASPEPPPQFVPPAGWHELVPGVSGGLPDQYLSSLPAWVHGSGDGAESVSLSTAPSKGLSLDKYVSMNSIQLQRSATTTLLSSVPVALCDGAKAQLVTYQRLVAGKPAIVAQIIAVDDTTGYTVTYARFADRPESQAGVTALKSLCPPKREALAIDKGAPIAPPTGWTKIVLAVTPGGGAAVWTWFHVGATGNEAIMAASVPTVSVADTGSDAQIASLTKGISTWASDVVVVDRKTVQLCRASGLLVNLTATTHDKAIVIEAVLSPGFPTSYFAVYARPQGVAENPDALQSIMSLCPADRETAA